MKPDKSPYHISQAASELFLKKGFEQVTMSDIAQAAGLTEAEIYLHFGNKQDLILFLYASINADWQLSVNDLSAKTVSERFEIAMAKKLDLMLPYLDVLANMTGILLSDSKISIRSPRTSHIRSMGIQIMETIIGENSRKTKDSEKKPDHLPSLLYLIHWAILFLFVQTRDINKTKTAVRLAARLIRPGLNFSFLLNRFPLYKDISLWAAELVGQKEHVNHSVDREILKIIFNNRKTSHAEPSCLDHSCETCMAIHQDNIRYFTSQNKPVHFVLPAFPAKSPNLKKVLGILPDLAEEIALKNLEDFCKEISHLYPPGAFVTICSDGRIFSKLVGVTDEDVTAYVKAVRNIISRLKLSHVEIVNLEDLIQGGSFEELRNKILADYAEPIEILNERLKTNTEFKELFNGIHRFITDDRRALFPEVSTTKLKNESKEIALKVIQHSNAWTRFLTYIYPQAIRLSIHPYPSHSQKIGIRLTKATDNWLTPWHGVIVLEEDGYVLMKKQEAEEKNAKLILENGVPYYYTLLKTVNHELPH